MTPPACLEAATAEIDQTLIRKIISDTPKGLAAGPSGLRVEHLHTLLSDRRTVVDSVLLELLTKLVNLALGRDFPPALQPFFCCGRLVPLNKKDEGIRPS